MIQHRSTAVQALPRTILTSLLIACALVACESSSTTGQQSDVHRSSTALTRGQSAPNTSVDVIDDISSGDEAPEPPSAVATTPPNPGDDVAFGEEDPGKPRPDPWNSACGDHEPGKPRPDPWRGDTDDIDPEDQHEVVVEAVSDSRSTL